MGNIPVIGFQATIKAHIINFNITRKFSIIDVCLYLDIIIAFDNFEYNDVYTLMNFGIALFSVFVILLLPTSF